PRRLLPFPTRRSSDLLGRPAEIYSRPASRFVAGFIGSPGMAFSRFGVERGAGGVVLTRAGTRLDAGPMPGELPPEVIVGVRPERSEEHTSELQSLTKL